VLESLEEERAVGKEEISVGMKDGVNGSKKDLISRAWDTIRPEYAVH
jgi:hypothetical protein